MHLLRSAIVLVALLAAAGTVASNGTAIDPQGDPIEGVRVCYVAGEVEQLCVETDARGRWQLPASRIDTVRLSADGFVARKISSLPQGEPTILQRAAILVIRLLDANGKPIAEGEADLVRPNGKKVGPFPLKAAGTRIRSLDPGPIVVVGRSDGFKETASPQTELISGDETVIEIRLSR